MNTCSRSAGQFTWGMGFGNCHICRDAQTFRQHQSRNWHTSTFPRMYSMADPAAIWMCLIFAAEGDCRSNNRKASFCVLVKALADATPEALKSAFPTMRPCDSVNLRDAARNIQNNKGLSDK